MRENWQTFRRVIGYYPRVLKLVWEASARYMLLIILVTVLSSAVPPAQVWMSKVIIDRVTEALRTSTQGLPFDWYAVLIPIGLIFLVWVLGGVCQSLRLGIREQMGFQVANYVEYTVLKKAAQLDIAFYENPAFFDQMEKARRDNFRVHNLAILWVEIFGGLLSLCAMLGLLFRLHPMAVVVLLFTSVPLVVVGGYYASRRFALMSTHTPARRMISYLSDLLGSRDAVKEIRLFGLHDPFLERFRHFWQ
ncbi:MAG: ABC transporter ATP-binding protein, partial [Candidatus Latescibacteria bacterium]|nr:ABC transporter ATP-binding protein [Candidatus Latescibacterota bacterium]